MKFIKREKMTFDQSYMSLKKVNEMNQHQQDSIIGIINHKFLKNS